MKNLGKIILFLIFIFPNAIYAGVVASVNTSSVTVGETVTLSLSISGEEIQKPALFKICGNDIVSTSSQTSIKMVNLDYHKSYVLSYKFAPQKSCTIEPIEVEVDSKIERTQPIEIAVKEYVRDLNDDFILTYSTAKTDVRVGEPFDLTLNFKQKRNVQAVDSKFIAPEYKGFWIKGESQPTRVNQGDYTITTIVYTMAAQREGELEIEPAQMKIASRENSRNSWDSWTPSVKWKTYLSNSLKMQVSPLPQGASLVGDFEINVKVDKSEVNSNEALNATIELVGKGNLEDVKSFKPYIQGVSVFDEKIVLSRDKLTQKIAFVSDSDFTIPPFSLEYFDLQTQQMKKIQTKEMKIKVHGSKPTQELVIKRDAAKESKEAPVVVISSTISPLIAGLIFTLGFILGGLLIFFKPWTLIKREKTFSIKDPKVLLVKLMPFSDDADVQSLVDVLEKNLYSNAKLELDKKLLKECLHRYNIS